MKRYRNFQPDNVAPNRHSIGGLLAVVAVQGMIVVPHATTENTLELATGKAGYFLRRDVVSAADFKTWIEQEELHPNKQGFEMPYKQGTHCQAEDHEAVWVEGAGLLDASMDETVVAGQQVTSAAGKVAVLTDSEAQECLGVVRQVVDAHNGDGKRFLIQVMRSAAVIPAV